MLQTVSIKNLALIKSENIEFNKRLNIILGETGAGKSLIFEALSFVLGLKTDKTLLRTGEESMKVDALFVDLPQSIKKSLKTWRLNLMKNSCFQERFQVKGEVQSKSMETLQHYLL